MITLLTKIRLAGLQESQIELKDAFASQKYDAVVLLFVDAFGWRFYERFQDAPFIKRMEKQGRIEKLTSEFPSTTAAHVTTLHTGLPVGMTGVHEWYYYEPKVDRIIAPLLFSFAGTERDLSKTEKSTRRRSIQREFFTLN